MAPENKNSAGFSGGMEPVTFAIPLQRLYQLSSAVFGDAW